MRSLAVTKWSGNPWTFLLLHLWVIVARSTDGNVDAGAKGEETKEVLTKSQEKLAQGQKAKQNKNTVDRKMIRTHNQQFEEAEVLYIYMAVFVLLYE